MIGILLAAGFSRRYGSQNKLLELLPDGQRIALRAADHLIQALPNSVAVVREDNVVLVDELKMLGYQVVLCDQRHLEMADSLTAAVRTLIPKRHTHYGCVIALADMPFIQVKTIQQVAAAIINGAKIAMPIYQQQRGHPIGFSQQLYDELAMLKGDEGARSIIKKHGHAVTLLTSDDAGILQDIDTPADLEQLVNRN